MLTEYEWSSPEQSYVCTGEAWKWKNKLSLLIVLKCTCVFSLLWRNIYVTTRIETVVSLSIEHRHTSCWATGATYTHTCLADNYHSWCWQRQSDCFISLRYLKSFTLYGILLPSHDALYEILCSGSWRTWAFSCKTTAKIAALLLHTPLHRRQP